MSKLIRQLLNESDPRFTISLTRLEFAAGKPGIDSRLTAEILSTVMAKMQSIGLDPRDTTGAELYAALCEKAVQADEQVRAYLGHPANIDSGAEALKKMALEIVGKKDTWSVKMVSLRGLLKANPPKKVMKAFHFQSVDSMAKRMDPAEVIMAARVVESKTWWLKTKKLFDEFGTKDFEKSQLKLIALSDERWIKVMTEHALNVGHGVIGSKECGAVGFVPLDGKTAYVSTLTRILHSINEVLLHGAFLKLHYVNPSIGNILVHAIDEGELMHTSVSGAVFHWRDIQRYYGTLPDESDTTFAHLDVHDLGWVSLETQLSLRIPELAFWVGLDFCGVSYGDGRVISCNVMDVSLSANMGLSHSRMFTDKMARSLRSELMARYVSVPVARALVLKQFDISGINEENW